MNDIAIRARHLSKRYKIGFAQHKHDTLRDQISHSLRRLSRRERRPHDETFWALKDVSFDLKMGDVVGIIGGNGAGKSTLLKILSRITEPTEGNARIYGRVGSLLEVGTGFHAELTGRENIFLNGAILGMKKAEIERKFDEIVSFSEIEKFIDTPVKRYSSGMYVRLAFAVAAYLEPDVLIVDEVLAVGDASFQKKCLGKMEGVAREGRTVLLVSHNMAAIENLCTRVFCLHSGKLEFCGNTKEGIDCYLRQIDRRSSNSNIVDLRAAKGRSKNCVQALERLELLTDEGEPLQGSLKIGAPLRIRVSFRLDRPTPNFEATLGFDNHLGQRVFTASTMFQPNRPNEERVGAQALVCDIPSLTLVPGEYRIKVLLNIGNVDIDRVEDAVRITILESDYYGTGRAPENGMVVLRHHWYPA